MKVLEKSCEIASNLGLLVVETSIHAARYLRKRKQHCCISYPGPVGDFIDGEPFFYFTSIPKTLVKPIY
jgi:hypothetical protein